MNKSKGFADPLTLCVVAACLIVGGCYMFFSKEIDSAGEQIVEGGLATVGVNVDFSAGKKQNAKQSQSQVQSQADNSK